MPYSMPRIKSILLLACLLCYTSAQAIWLSPDPLLDKYPNGDMLPLGSKDGKYHPISTGCLIIAPTRMKNGQVFQKGWDQFVNQIGNVNTFTIRLKRK